ncbi:MAG: OmpW family outer membrane protein [Alphaproteobacteria bacterium]
MTITAKTAAVAAVIGLVAWAPVDAYAKKEAGDILVRLRGIAMIPDAGGGTIEFGGDADLDNDYVPELDFTYFFTENIAAELILATTRHEVTVKGSSAGDLDLGHVSMLPPILSLQWRFLPKEMFSPYVGAGLNYTFFYRESDGGSITSINYENSFGYALQAGLDIGITDSWSLNIDVKKVFLDTDIVVNGGTINAPDTDLDPWVIGIGFGYRF